MLLFLFLYLACCFHVLFDQIAQFLIFYRTLSSWKPNVRLYSGHWYTVNDLINANFQINASYLINTASTLLKLYGTPLSNKRPYETRN